MEEKSQVVSEAIKRNVTLFSATGDSITNYIISHAASLKRIEKGKIQLLILTCSRERAFLLFSRICRVIHNMALICHAAVGSLKFERDLKALNYGVDILIVTPGRIKRLYDRNENCFDSISTIFIDEAESLFTRGMLLRVCAFSLIHIQTKECCEMFPTSHLSIFHTLDTLGEKLCTLDSLKSLLSTVQFLFPYQVSVFIIHTRNNP